MRTEIKCVLRSGWFWKDSLWTTGRVPEVITYLNFPSFVHFLNNQPLVHVTAHLTNSEDLLISPVLFLGGMSFLSLESGRDTILKALK